MIYPYPGQSLIVHKRKARLLVMVMFHGKRLVGISF